MHYSSGGPRYFHIVIHVMYLCVYMPACGGLRTQGIDIDEFLDERDFNLERPKILFPTVFNDYDLNCSISNLFAKILIVYT